jgi:hypothetical protein
MLTGTLIGRRPASQAIVSASTEPEISGQPSTPVYRIYGQIIYFLPHKSVVKIAS